MEIFYTLFIFVSIYLSIHISNWIAAQWGGPPPNATGLKAFLTCAVLLSIGLFFIAKMASSAIKGGAGGRVNAVAGLFFSILKTTMVLSILLLIGEKINGKVQWMPREQKQASFTYEPIYKLSFLVLPAMEESALYKNGIKEINPLETLESDEN